MERLSFALFDTSLGWLGVIGSQHGLKEVILPQESKEAVLGQIKARGYAVETCNPALFGDLLQRLKRYLKGEKVQFPDKLDFGMASGFRKGVWSITCAIPYGETRSYAWVAAQLDMPKAARAVGQALGRNPLPIIVPCHRVLSSDGGLCGFSAGLDMKRRLLSLEHAGIR